MIIIIIIIIITMMMMMMIIMIIYVLTINLFTFKKKLKFLFTKVSSSKTWKRNDRKQKTKQWNVNVTCKKLPLHSRVSSNLPVLHSPQWKGVLEPPTLRWTDDDDDDDDNNKYNNSYSVLDENNFSQSQQARLSSWFLTKLRQMISQTVWFLSWKSAEK